MLSLRKSKLPTTKSSLAKARISKQHLDPWDMDIIFWGKNPEDVILWAAKCYRIKWGIGFYEFYWHKSMAKWPSQVKLTLKKISQIGSSARNDENQTCERNKKRNAKRQVIAFLAVKNRTSNLKENDLPKTRENFTKRSEKSEIENLHSRKLTWIPKMMVWKWQFLVSMLDFCGVPHFFTLWESY